MDDRLPTSLMVQAGVASAAAAGVGVYVVRKGDDMAGLILLRLDIAAGQRLVVQGRDLDGRRVWQQAGADAVMAAPDAEAYTDRAVQRDPDLWVIDVDDPAGERFFVM